GDGNQDQLAGGIRLGLGLGLRASDACEHAVMRPAIAATDHQTITTQPPQRLINAHRIDAGSLSNLLPRNAISSHGSEDSLIPGNNVGRARTPTAAPLLAGTSSLGRSRHGLLSRRRRGWLGRSLRS